MRSASCDKCIEGRLAEEGADQRTWAVIAALDVIARRGSVSRVAVGLVWLMANPSHPVPIIGTQTAERLADARRALELRLTRGDWYVVLTASRQKRLP